MTFLNLYSLSLDLETGSRNSGANPIDEQTLCKLLSVANIVTGSDILRIPLPEKIFFFRVLTTNFMTSLWVLIFA